MGPRTKTVLRLQYLLQFTATVAGILLSTPFVKCFGPVPARPLAAFATHRRRWNRSPWQDRALRVPEPLRREISTRVCDPPSTALRATEERKARIGQPDEKSLPTAAPVAKNGAANGKTKKGRTKRSTIGVSRAEAVVDDDETMDDSKLLQQTPKRMLQDLCEQFGLSKTGKKDQLLQRLRDYATEQAEAERQRRIDRKRRVENGTGSDKERYESLDRDDLFSTDDHDVGDDDTGVFYYHNPKVDVPANNNDGKYYDDDDNNNNTTHTGSTKADTSSAEVGDRQNSGAIAKTKTPTPAKTRDVSKYINRDTLTAPPPPIEPNEKGERVVTIYSSSETNDLTSVAAAQPGHNANANPMIDSYSGGTHSHWQATTSETNSKAAPTNKQLEAAKEKVIELVSVLLSNTGAPGFQQDSDDLEMLGVTRQPTNSNGNEFVGFDPSLVDPKLLASMSQFLRTGRGRVLAEAMDQFELRAVGYDSIAGDDREKGGGHYREVVKVRTFLDGYRKAEVRRIARETVTLLLDKLVSEGIEGLDITLATMIRSSDDTSNEGGELNDSLVQYLNDAIRQQREKVERIASVAKNAASLESSGRNVDGTGVNTGPSVDDEDRLQKLWKVEKEGNQTVETFDPKDPESQKLLDEEMKKMRDKESQQKQQQQQSVPVSAEEKLLLLLELLKERVKIEAAFGADEKSKNLRVLSYCCRLPSDSLRIELLLKEFGSSVSRIDSFIELVTSSVEYAESTSYELQPAKTMRLDVSMLRGILSLAQSVRESQSWKATGIKQRKVHMEK